MHRFLDNLLFVCFALIASTPVRAAAPEGVPGYRLGTGDEIGIEVFGEPELTVTVRVNESGRVVYPLLGDLTVGGKTPDEIERHLTDALEGDYLVKPQVSVRIREYRPVFINGAVARPGSYPFQPGMTVRKAASLAGGLTERASERRITLIREGQDRSKATKVSLDQPIGPGDIVTIDESFF